MRMSDCSRAALGDQICRLGAVPECAGDELRLVVCGFIRPEADFTTLDALVARIHEDANVSHAALQAEPYASLAQDTFLMPS